MLLSDDISPCQGHDDISFFFVHAEVIVALGFATLESSMGLHFDASLLNTLSEKTRSNSYLIFNCAKFTRGLFNKTPS